MNIQLAHKYEDIISIDNLLLAWKEFIRGKRSKPDIQQFQLNLMDNIISLHNNLKNGTYKHGGYKQFNICDPKPRRISKALVRDRLLHHATHRIIYPFFDRTFSSASFSCRINKGTHRAVNQFRKYGYKESRNNTKTCYILKCDIRKFFDNIDHQVLLSVLKKYIPDENIIRLLEEIINSFHSNNEEIGLPLGNLTSQLFVNIYMNEFDQFIKRILKARHYVRYADDFVVFSENRDYLLNLILPIREFLKEVLKLELHPDKVFIETLSSGVDFLGWVNFFNYRVLRTSTRRRMLKRLRVTNNLGTLNSYLGLLRHGNTYKVREQIYKNLK